MDSNNLGKNLIYQNLPSTSDNFGHQKNDTDCFGTIKTVPQNHDELHHHSKVLDLLKNKKSDKNCEIEIEKDKLNSTKTKSGTLQKRPKRLGPTCHKDFCRKSKYRLCSNFDEETRQRIFDEFWKNLNCDQRHIYVATRVFRETPKNRRQSEKDSRRAYTLIYTLRNSNGNSEQVCRDMFLNTLSISERQVALWVKKYSIGGNGVSQTKLKMLKSMTPSYKKLSKEKEISNTVKKMKNSPLNCENKIDVECLAHFLDYDSKNVSNLDENIKFNHEISNENIPKNLKRKPIDPNSPDKTKRKRNAALNPELWKRNVNKLLRLEGKAYKSGPRRKCSDESALIERKAKELLPPCNSPQCNTSRLRHCSTISEWRREQIFNDFWNKWDWNQRKIFVASIVTRKETHRKKLKNGIISRRQATLIYNLPNDHGIPVQICQKMFSNTTGVSGSQVLRWIKKFHLVQKETVIGNIGIGM